MAEQGFTLTSPAFAPDGNIPAECTCDGDNESPELKWIHPPEETRSFALFVEDLDAPRGTLTHWVLYDVPSDAESIPRAKPHRGIDGRNDFGHVGYGGPCPPPNHGKHRYYFKLFALDVDSLNLEEGASRAAVEAAMEGHTLGKTELMGRFERTTG
jgi:Raf kinase inhibitor-like YbhB/YbcL family protein